LAAPQPTKSFEERSLKMRKITNIKNKKYWPLQLFSDGASAAAGRNFHFGQFRVSQGQQGSDTYVFYSPDRGGHLFIFGLQYAKKCLRVMI
jgi:hypothetical protein